MNNTAAEGTLLAGFIRHPDEFFQYTEFLDPEQDFTHLSLQMLYSVIRSLYVERELKAISRLNILSEAKELGYGNFTSVTNNLSTVDKLLDEQAGPAEIRDAFMKVKKATVVRDYTHEFSELTAYMRQTDDPVTAVVDKVESAIYKKSNTIDSDEGIISLSEGAEATIMSMADNPGQLGLDFNMPLWQARIGQLRNGSVHLIAAHTGTGKSQQGVYAALCTARTGRPVIIADSELKEEDQQIRLVGMYAGVPYGVLETGYWKLTDAELQKEGFDQEEIKHIAECRKRMQDPVLWDKVKALPIDYLNIVGKSMEEVIPLLRRWVLTKVKPDKDAKFPECLIVYDYVKLASVDELKGGRVAEWQVHGLNMATLHDFAQKYNVPVLTFGQTNREIDDSLDCIAGAKRITDNCDSVSLLKVKSDTEQPLSPNGNYLMRVLKSRFGKTTFGGHINYSIDASCWNLEELDYQVINFREAYQRRLDDWKKNRDDDDD